MQSLRELFRVGTGPSSSHTIGPSRAAALYRARTADATGYTVTLYASLAATGRGHRTDVAIQQALAPAAVSFQWKPEARLPLHPNALELEAQDGAGAGQGPWRVYSVGGGALVEEGQEPPRDVYGLATMDALLQWSERSGRPLWQHVEAAEGPEIWPYLAEIWQAMQASMERGLHAEGSLPGGLGLARKSRSYFLKAQRSRGGLERTGLLSAYALAVTEENASSGTVVTAPTCGACGVLPAVLRYCRDTQEFSEAEVLRALATAGLVGNLIKRNASISGAEVGCQGEVGSACAMAAAAAAQLLGGSPRQIEYAAEMGLEHHLGLTCDPVLGLVQIPCIERNAFAATRAMDSADYALLSDGEHHISFDEVVQTMKLTGQDLQAKYRETAAGGLAAVHRPKVWLMGS